jgi:hypothetical protein
MEVYGEVQVYFQLFLSRHSVEVSGPIQAPAALLPGFIPKVCDDAGGNRTTVSHSSCR